MNTTTKIGLFSLVLGSTLFASTTWAQAWPTKPIKVIVPSSVGSAPDQIARMVSDKLSAKLGQPIIIDNKPGAGGIINMNQLKQSDPDGYTLSIIQGAVAAVTPYMYKEATFDVVRDYSVVGTIGMTPMLFVSNPDFPAKTLSEAIEAAKAAPGTIAIGSSTRGSIPNLANELLAARTGASFQIVPFSGSSQGIQAAVGGVIPLFTDGVAAVMPLIKGGRLHALAAASDTVLPGLEGIPLAKDTVPELNVYGWFAMIAPKNTPNNIVQRLNVALDEVVNSPEIVQKFRNLGTYPKSASIADSEQFIKDEITTFSSIIKSAGVKAE
jgi:tripartite-type tricarboxylate transporter receptor subunit TctC